MPWGNWINSITESVNSTFSNEFKDDLVQVDGNSVQAEEEFTSTALSRRGRRKRNKKLSNKLNNGGCNFIDSDLSVKADQTVKPKYFSQSRLAYMKMTIDSIIYYFEEFHNKEFERISPASSSATATFYFLLIQKITNPNTPLFHETESDNGKGFNSFTTLKSDLGIYGKQLNKVINMNIHNRIHLTKLVGVIATLLDTQKEKFSVEPEYQHCLNRLKNECYYITKAVEYDITYAQACNPKLVHQLDLLKKQQQHQH